MRRIAWRAEQVAIPPPIRNFYVVAISLGVTSLEVWQRKIATRQYRISKRLYRSMPNSHLLIAGSALVTPIEFSKDLVARTITSARKPRFKKQYRWIRTSRRREC